MGLKKTVVLVEATPLTWRNWPCLPGLALGTLHWFLKGIWSSRPRQAEVTHSLILSLWLFLGNKVRESHPPLLFKVPSLPEGRKDSGLECVEAKIWLPVPYSVPFTLCISFLGQLEQSQSGRLETAEMCSFIVLEDRSLKSRCWQGRALSEGSREESSLPFPASGGPSGPWCFLAFSGISPVSACSLCVLRSL